MLRRQIIGGNWKMNRGTPNETHEMLEKLLPLTKTIDKVDIIIAPPYTSIYAALSITKDTNIKIGAQNMYFEEKGAFTGEVSPNFLKDIGVQYVILGHSERRDIFKESNEVINKKLKKALLLDLKPIVCIGEHLEERQAGKTRDVLEFQIKKTFMDLNRIEMEKTVIAYEPIWAIGTGKSATPEQAEEIHVFIRDQLSKMFDQNIANSVRIQYGGSIKPANAEELFKKENIDGGLVGGASLQADSFFQIIKAAEDLI